MLWLSPLLADARLLAQFWASEARAVSQFREGRETAPEMELAAERAVRVGLLVGW